MTLSKYVGRSGSVAVREDGEDHGADHAPHNHQASDIARLGDGEPSRPDDLFDPGCDCIKDTQTHKKG